MWLQVFQLLLPLLTGPASSPHTAPAVALASQIPAVLHPDVPQHAKDSHLGQIFQLLLTSGLISSGQVPASVTLPAVVAS